MNLKELNTFLAIVRYGSFRKAAEVLNYTPTSVTNQIHNLEHSLGATLFERGKKVKLTQVGMLLAEEGGRLTTMEQHLESMIADLVNGSRGSITIGAAEPAMSMFIPRIMLELTQLYPDIQIKVAAGYSEELSKKLKDGLVDIVLASKSSYPGKNYKCIDLFESNFNMVVFSHQHRLKQIDPIRVADLNGERIMVPPHNAAWRSRLISELNQKGCTNFQTVEFDQVQGIIPFIENNYMISILHNEEVFRRKYSLFNLDSKVISDLNLKRTFSLFYDQRYNAQALARDNVVNYIIRTIRSEKF